MKIKTLAILMIITFLIFIAMVIGDRFFNTKKQLLIEDYVNIDVKRFKSYKNILIFNDTISIFKGTRRVFPNGHKHFYRNYYKEIESVEAPYRLLKEKHSSIIIVIKDYDSLFYKLQDF